MGMKLWNLEMIQNKVTEQYPYYNCGDDLLIFANNEQEARRIAHENMDKVREASIWLLPEHSTCVVVAPEKGRKTGYMFAVMARIE
jgi:hypothetical protein